MKSSDRADAKLGPAVAGKNATNPQPVYKDWKGHHRVHSAVVGPRIQKQIENIYAKAAQPSTPTSVKAEHSKTANLIKEDWFGPDEPAVNFNLPRPDDYFYLPPADSYRNMSIGIGAFSPPFHQQCTPSPRQTSGSYTAPSPAAPYTDGTTHYGMRGSYGGMGGSHGSVDDSYDDMGDNHPSFGPGPHYFDSNNPKTHNNSGQSGGHSSGPTEMQIKDKVITALAGIVEMLEINYGISIDDQTDTFQKFMNIARSLEEDERETGSAASSDKTRGKYPR